MPHLSNLTVHELLREYDRSPNSINVLRECARRLQVLSEEKDALRELLDRLEEETA